MISYSKNKAIHHSCVGLPFSIHKVDIQIDMIHCMVEVRAGRKFLYVNDMQINNHSWASAPKPLNDMNRVSFLGQQPKLQIMCCSRKCPYPFQKRFFGLDFSFKTLTLETP